MVRKWCRNAPCQKYFYNMSLSWPESFHKTRKPVKIVIVKTNFYYPIAQPLEKKRPAAERPIALRASCLKKHALNLAPHIMHAWLQDFSVHIKNYHARVKKFKTNTHSSYLSAANMTSAASSKSCSCHCARGLKEHGIEVASWARLS